MTPPQPAADQAVPYRPAIALIGYRGCGKSSVAARIATTTGAAHVDTDDLIVRQAGRDIARIFVDEGEPGFRQREAAVIAEVAAQIASAAPADRLAVPTFVVSSGGGAVLDPANTAALRRVAVVILLRASAEALHRRIAADAGTPASRPPLTTAGGLEEVRTLLARREPAYAAAAEAEIDTEQLDPAAVATAAIDHWRRLAGRR